MNTLLARFKRNATLMILVSGIIETAIFFSLENIFATLALITGWYILKLFALTDRNLKHYPVSFIMLLGLSVFYYLLPLPLTLLELNPVTFNLRVPTLTFTHHLLFAIFIVLTYRIYINISNKKNVFRSILANTNFYIEPTNRVIWFSALLGLAASYYNYFVLGIWQIENADRSFLYYFNTILSQFVWMPLILLFSKFRINQPPINKIQIIQISVYSIFVLIMAVASNWRTIIFSGIFLVMGLFGVGLLLNHYDVKKVLALRKVVLTVVIFIFISGPLVDLSASMVVVRGERTSLSAFEFLNRTINEYSNKDNIKSIKNSTINNNTNLPYRSFDWDETYLSNIILNRLVNLKISDNCLYYATQIGFENKRMQSEMFKQLKASMPSVLISFFGENPAKLKADTSYSIGDYLYSLAINSSSELGSAKISSMTGVGMATFGYWYLILLIPIFIVIFTMFDSFVCTKNKQIVFSYFFFLSFLISLNYFNDRHVFTMEFKYITRTYLESVVLFLVAFKLMRWLTSLKLPSLKIRRIS